MTDHTDIDAPTGLVHEEPYVREGRPIFYDGSLYARLCPDPNPNLFDAVAALADTDELSGYNGGFNDPYYLSRLILS
jgi:hypothetical protein